jgi:uncharacterized LabA/DUF88 family protein
MSDIYKEINYAFIDSQNLNLGIRSKGWELDFKRFRIYLNDKYHVKKAFLFIGYIERNEKLYSYLRRVGYTLVFKPTIRYRKDGKNVIKGNVDVELVMTVMIELENFHRAVIVSGDGDFYFLIKYLFNMDKLEVLLVPNKKYSSLLRKFQENIFVLSLKRDLLEKRKTEIRGRSKP